MPKRQPHTEREVEVIDDGDEDNYSGDVDRRKNQNVTRSPRADRLITWGLLVAGSGAATILPWAHDPAPQIEKLAAELRGVTNEMRGWREGVTNQLEVIKIDVALVKYQIGRPDLTDDKMRKLEDRMLILEREKR